MVREPVADPAFLHFTLEQVTERRDEVPFEHLCRKLAEKEICPNLKPQTGPTGGGDSKVDTETYPVSERIAALWYVGNPERSSKERWAFAFSAKRDWRSKIKDDIRKMAETGRGYTVAYFMTNQQVSDRARSTLEDDLKTKWNIDVRILDRNWIADKVLTNDHLDLFESTLQVSLNRARTRQLGEADAVREQNLKELDSQIDDPGRYAGVGGQLAEDCLETALLARGLDRPRMEVEGRFDRAERAAYDYGSKRQLLRIKYHRAWTVFFWYEDNAEFGRLYKAAVSLGLDTDNVWDLERLVFLWQLGTASRINEGTLGGDTEWKKRTRDLRGAIECIVGDEARPTSSLMARTLIALMTITEEHNREALSAGAKEVVAVLQAARHLLDYPFDSMARIVEELINLAGGDEGLDRLLDEIIEIQAERVGHTQEGRMRLQRALVCVKAGRCMEAIRQAGKAQVLLGHSGGDEFLQSIVTTAFAYEAMGLLWAARANYAFALHWVLRDGDTEGTLSPSSLMPLARLVWIEIQLGRISQALCWLEFHSKLVSAVDLTESQLNRLGEEVRQMDAILAIVVLRTQWPDLSKLDRTPGVFRILHLNMSRWAMMFLLGYEPAIKSESGLDEPAEFFEQLLGQPAAHDVAEIADWGIRCPFSARTTLFGCQIDMLVQGGLRSLLLGETILAFLESFLATSGMSKGVLSARAQLSIEIVVKDNAKQPFEYKLVEDDVGDVKIVVAHRNDLVKVVDEQYIRTIMELFAHVLGQLWMSMSKKDIEALFAIERAQDRASMTAQLPVVFDAMLGNSVKVDAQSWMEIESESFTLCREAPWRATVTEAVPGKHEKPHTQGANGTGNEKQISGVDAVRHRDTKVFSVLNIPLWDMARWKGMGYTFPRWKDDIPEMRFLFENIDAGRKIFRGWIKKFGAADPDDTIGITLVTGIDRAHPDWYRVVVGYRDADILKSRARFLGFTFRIQEMNPENGRNLEQFLRRYSQLGRYRIAPMEHQTTAGLFETGPSSINIEKRLVKVVPAWTIGPDDFLRAALKDIVNPVVPSGEEDPPFYKPSALGEGAA